MLLALTPVGVYLAFPLFFLQLHLLPARPGLVAVSATTLAAISGFAWHQGSLTLAVVVGPALGAAVAVATVRQLRQGPRGRARRAGSAVAASATTPWPRGCPASNCPRP